MNLQTANFLANKNKTNIGSTPLLSEALKLFLKGQYLQSSRLLNKLAINGNYEAIMLMGYLYEFGLGVKQNYKNACYWYFHAVNLNQYNHRPLTRALRYFYDPDQLNYKKSAEWFRMSAELSIDRY